MAYRWLDDLDQALAAWDIPFVEVGPSAADYTGSDDWRTRGRPASTGEFEPVGILCHHTASPAGTSDEADINAILWGNSSAPGPISQIYLGRSGICYLIAAGRANHGGQGIRPGIDSGCADMNANLLGIEGGNSGVGEFWPDAQIETYTAIVGALCEWYGWPLEAVYLHATTGPPGGGCNSKIDPAGPWAGQPELTGSTTWDLELWRQWCQGTATGEPPPTHGGIMLTLFQCSDAWACFLGMTAGNAPGVGQLVEWTDGPTKAFYAGLGAHEQTITVEQCSGFSLMGPLPQGDQAHAWDGSEFRRLVG